MAGIDWASLKTEYATTTVSYRELAQKYGIPFNTLKDHALKEKWRQAREEYTNKVTKKATQKIAASAATAYAIKLSKLQSAADSLAAVIDKVFNDTQQFNRHLVQVRHKSGESEDWDVEQREFEKIDTKAIKELSGALKDLTTVIRNVYDIPTVQEQTAMDIAAARLKLEQQKAGDGEDDKETGVILLPAVLPEKDGQKEVKV